MKLAEALVQIKDLKGKFTDLQRVMYSDATFDRVDTDTEVPNIEEKLFELVDVSNSISLLKSRVTRTNAQHGLTDKIHKMEHLRSCVSKLEELTHNKQVVVSLRNQFMGEQVLRVSTHATYDVALLTDKVNNFRTRIRELDLELQRLNWEVDLVE